MSAQHTQTSTHFAGPDITQSLMESKSTVVDDCSSARASLQELSDDVNKFDAQVQKRIQQLRLELMQATHQEESLTAG